MISLLNPNKLAAIILQDRVELIGWTSEEFTLSGAFRTRGLSGGFRTRGWTSEEFTQSGAFE